MVRETVTYSHEHRIFLSPFKSHAKLSVQQPLSIMIFVFHKTINGRLVIKTSRRPCMKKKKKIPS